MGTSSADNIKGAINESVDMNNHEEEVQLRQAEKEEKDSGHLNNDDTEQVANVTKQNFFWSTLSGQHTFCERYYSGLKWTSYLIFILLIWGILYTLLPRDMSLYGDLLKLLVTFIFAVLLGEAVALIRMPKLLGMLIAGIIVRNIGYFDLNLDYRKLVPILRNTAMVVILIKAGLGLDGKVLRRMSFSVLLLAFGPCCCEALTAAVSCHLMLGYSWGWCLLLGFILGAVSPAVVVPSLLSLKEQGYGEDKGISTLVIAASSIDDIAAISGFGIVLSILFSGGNLFQQIMQGPLEVTIGLSFGIIWGLLSIVIPHQKAPCLTLGRSFMVIGGGIFAVLGSQKVGYSGAGPLSCIILSFVACWGWKRQGWPADNNPVQNIVSALWVIWQPVLFSLIGTEINFYQLNGDTVSLGFAILVCGLIVRICACFATLTGSGLSLKEKIFVCIAWLPKATVQAAIGPVALDIARSHMKYQNEQVIAEQILTIAVLSILITAPIGAIGISLTGPTLLSKTQIEAPTDSDKDVVPKVCETDSSPPAVSEFNEANRIV